MAAVAPGAGRRRHRRRGRGGRASCVNGATALLFARGRGRDLNIRSAFLHMAADALVTAGVVVAGIAIVLTGLSWLDPAVSLDRLGGHRLRRLGSGEAGAEPRARRGAPGGRRRRGADPSAGAARGRGAARPPHLGHEHDRDRAHLPSGDARRPSRRRGAIAYRRTSSSTSSASTTRRSRSRSATARPNAR